MSHCVYGETEALGGSVTAPKRHGSEVLVCGLRSRAGWLQRLCASEHGSIVTWEVAGPCPRSSVKALPSHCGWQIGQVRLPGDSECLIGGKHWTELSQCCECRDLAQVALAFLTPISFSGK